MAQVSSILDLIGNTPLVDVSSLSPNPAVRILVKLEGQNPGGSVKDRIALSMVEEAEKDGRLSPGDTLLEPSSGNTGIGLGARGAGEGIPPQGGAALERVGGAPPAARGVGSRGHRVAGVRGVQRGGAHGPAHRTPSTPSGSSSTSTPTRPTPRRTTRGPVPRSGATVPR